MRSNDPAFAIAVSVWVDGQAGATWAGNADADGDEQPVRVGLRANGGNGDAGGGLGALTWTERKPAEASLPAFLLSHPDLGRPSRRCLAPARR